MLVSFSPDVSVLDCMGFADDFHILNKRFIIGKHGKSFENGIQNSLRSDS